METGPRPPAPFNTVPIQASSEVRLSFGSAGGLRVLPLLLVIAWTVLRVGAANEPDSVPTPIRQEYRVAMRDGVRLATDVWLPGTNGAFPAVLLRFPYNKASAAGLGRDGVGRGYAVVAQDTSGRFASEGENLPFHRDVADGKDTLEWIAEQSWCNGRIGTWGGSAGAITQFQLAVGGTEKLGAQYLVVGAPNLYDVVYTGGVFRKALIEDWLRGTQFATNALGIWESHPLYDAYWEARDASRHYARIRTPAVHVGGYWDIFAQGTLDAFVGYQNRGGEGARGRQRLLMGPWAHAVLQGKVGELTFREGNLPPGEVSDAWRWFDHWLRDQDNGVPVDPAVTYYVLGDATDPAAPGNEWRTSDRWPPVDTVNTAYYLHGDRSLSTRAPGDSVPLAYRYDPRHPAPTVGGIQLTLPAGPMDQAAVESRDDVLVFTSATLTAPMEVTGRVRARLWVSSDAPDTDFFVRLCDLYPDGRSFNLCEGMLRARFRHGLDREEKLVPGEVVALDIDVWSTSIIFAPGHRLRVHVTSSSAPGFDPNPNTGEPFRSSDRTRVARNTVYVDAARPSQVILPVRPEPWPATRFHVSDAPPGMVLIPAGRFLMGDAFGEGWSDELPVHEVHVSALYMDQYEVTKALWDEVYTWAVANGYGFDNAGDGEGADHPVHSVNWHDCVKWCNARSEMEGRVPAYYTDAGHARVYRTGQFNVQNEWVKWDAGYRLPTEAEWEKAGRGGAEGRRFPWADANEITHSRANYNSHLAAAPTSYAYDISSTRGYHPDFQAGVFPYTSPVGWFEPNGYGLYDMAGNLWEHCWDRHGSTYYRSSPASDPRGPASGSDRVIRGGSWSNAAGDCRVARRLVDPTHWRILIGFRSVLPPG